MKPKYHQKYLAQKERVPEHIDKFETEKKNDIVIIYSLFEDLFPNKIMPMTQGTFVPQWVGMGMIDDQSGFCVNFSKKPTVCQNYTEMTNFAFKKIGTKNINKILFFYQNYCITINERDPFGLDVKIVFAPVSEEKVYVDNGIDVVTTLEIASKSTMTDQCVVCHTDTSTPLKCETCASVNLNYCSNKCLHAHQHDCQVNNIQHRNKFRLSDENDVMIVYSKFEHLHPDDKEYIGYYIPQWISTDLVNETRGVHSPLNIQVLCQSYQQMIALALYKITKEIPFKPKNIYFHYVTSEFILCNNNPFKQNSEYIIFEEKMVKACNFCQKYQDQMMKCAKCQIRHYCNQSCQKKDWRKHKSYCR